MATDSHTRGGVSLPSEATSHKLGPTPSTSTQASLTAPTISKSLSRTPPPSPSPFMRFFNASEPPSYSPRTNLPSSHKHVQHTHTASSSSQFQLLNRPYTTLRRIWREHRHIRRFFLSLVCVLVPTLLTAAYFAGAYRGAVAMKDPLTLTPDAPISDPNPIGAGAEGQEQGQGWRHLHGGLKRRAGVVPRQASSVDGADAPVLSLGGLGNTRSTSSSSTSTPSNGAISNSGTLSATPTTTRLSTVAPSIPTSPILPTPFVQPFDATLSTDFVSASCQTYFANLTQSLPFRQCRPFSLLLPTSQDFFSAQSNLTLLTSIVYGTCTTTPSVDECILRMDALANDLRTECPQELNAGHAMAWDALNGMKNYKMMREAACLRNLRTNAYCFVDAVAATPPSDIYFYQLPLGTPLPGTSGTSSADGASSTSTSPSSKLAKRRPDYPSGVGYLVTGGDLNSKGITVNPTCSACTQSLMGIYASYAVNASLLISQTYGAAQRAVDVTCGSGYASAISAATVVRPMYGVVAMLVAVGAVVVVGL